MSDEELRRRHTALRQAATALLAATESSDEPPPEYYSNRLNELRAALDGAAQPAEFGRVPNPVLHFLLYRDFDSGVLGGLPQSLAARTEEIRARLLTEEPTEPDPNALWPDDGPVVTEVTAMVSATLLHELAARLRAVAAADPRGDGEGLAEVAEEMAEDLASGTFVGVQR